MEEFKAKRNGNNKQPKKSSDKSEYPDYYDSLFYQFSTLAKVPETHYLCDYSSLNKYQGELASFFACASNFTQEVCYTISQYTNRIILVCEEITTQVINSMCLFLTERVPVFFYKKIQNKNVDGIEYLAHKWSQEENQEDRFRYIAELAEIISFCSDKIRRGEYIKAVAKKFKVKQHDFQLDVNRAINSRTENVTYADENIAKLPSHVDRDEFLNWGFYEEVEPGKVGYYFFKSKDTNEKISNFIVSPLFHVYNKNENKRLVEIFNGYERKIVELASKAMISLDMFCCSMFDEGYFIFEGGRPHLLKIMRKIGNKFPLCYELKTLGWQPEGFFAYSNCIYNGQLIDTDHYGIAEHDGINYYSPSASLILKDVRKEDDEYENDRYLLYVKSKIVFSEWADLLLKAYGKEKAAVGIAFSIMTIFKDVIYKLDNTCPNLYAYGPPQSGKTAWADSLSNLFFKDMKAFNLNQGTDYAFFSRLSRFRNCPVVFNEFDEEAIKEEWFRALKAVYDGEGRERGRGGSKNKTETQKINCTVILCGQILSTKDDGSVLSRCIIQPFEAVNDRSNDQADAFRKLKTMEKEGLAGILPELLTHRDEFKTKYPDAFDKNLKKVKEQLKKDNREFKERIARNYTAMFTCFEMLSEKLKLPISVSWFLDFCKKEIVRLSDLINNSNALADFWDTVVYLLEKGDLIHGVHFKIDVKEEIKLTINRDTQEVKKFPSPTKLIYLRLDVIHKLYAEATRRQTGRNGLNKQTLLLYIASEKGYLGNNPGSSFKSEKGGHSSTSSFVFEYNELGIDLERTDENESVEITTIDGSVTQTPEIKDHGSGPQVEFKIFKDESYEVDGATVSKSTYTRIVIKKDTSAANKIQAGANVKLTGELIIRQGKDMPFRTMYATSWQVETIQNSNNSHGDLPF